MYSEDLDMLNENGTCADCAIHYSDEKVTADAEADRLLAYASDEEKAEYAAEQENKWKMKGRLKSWAVWTAIVGLVSVLFSAFNIWERIGITNETFGDIAAALGSVLTAFGVLNDPTNREGF